MSTNFYVHGTMTKCPTCRQDAELPLHLGKSSAGWRFALHTIPDLGIHGWRDWVTFIETHQAQIISEYNEEWTPKQLYRLAKQKAHGRGHGQCDGVFDIAADTTIRCNTNTKSP